MTETTQNTAMKAVMPDIAQVLEVIRSRGYFGTLTRFPVAYDLAKAMAIVEAIGCSRDPKFVIDDENRSTYENFVKWCHGDPTMRAIDPTTGELVPGRLNRGIYIAGNTGTGKSWCLEIMHSYCAVMRFGIQLRNATPRPLLWSNVRADMICDAYRTSGDIRMYMTEPMIAIQDLGSEPPDVMYMGNRLEVMRSVIEYRGDRADQITLVTSNHRIAGETIAAHYGDRVVSRLQEMCNYLIIKGKDRRKIK